MTEPRASSEATVIVPRLGDLRLDQVTYAVIEDFKIGLAKTRINTDKSYRVAKIDAKSSRLLSAKTINNVLSVLNVLLKQAVEWGVLDKMPCSIRLVRVPRPP